MRMMKHRNPKFIGIAAVALALLITLPEPARAQEAGVPWEQLSRDEQSALKSFAGKWDQLPPAKQARLKKGAHRWAS